MEDERLTKLMGSVISFKHKGNFSRTTQYMERLLNLIHAGRFDKYGKAGVLALETATPTDTGKTAMSWYYRIEIKNGFLRLSFYNDSENDNIPIVILLQYGHYSRNEGWVEGKDFINPAIQPVFDQILSDLGEEVKRL